MTERSKKARTKPETLDAIQKLVDNSKRSQFEDLELLHLCDKVGRNFLSDKALREFYTVALMYSGASPHALRTVLQFDSEIEGSEYRRSVVLDYTGPTTAFVAIERMKTYYTMSEVRVLQARRRKREGRLLVDALERHWLTEAIRWGELIESSPCDVSAEEKGAALTLLRYLKNHL